MNLLGTLNKYPPPQRRNSIFWGSSICLVLWGCIKPTKNSKRQHTWEVMMKTVNIDAYEMCLIDVYDLPSVMYTIAGKRRFGHSYSVTSRNGSGQSRHYPPQGQNSLELGNMIHTHWMPRDPFWVDRPYCFFGWMNIFLDLLGIVEWFPNAYQPKHVFFSFG